MNEYSSIADYNLYVDIMDFMLRLPRWFLFLCSCAIVLPFGLSFLSEALYVFNDEESALQIAIYRSQDVLIYAAFIALYVLYFWYTAIVVRYCQISTNAWLLMLPLVLSIAFLSMLMVLILHKMLASLSPLEFFVERLGELIEEVTMEYFLGIGGLLLIISGLVVTYALIRLFGKRKRDWLFIPAQVCFFPIGLFWLQPKLKVLTQRLAVESPEDHFIE